MRQWLLFVTEQVIDSYYDGHSVAVIKFDSLTEYSMIFTIAIWNLYAPYDDIVIQHNSEHFMNVFNYCIF